MSTTSSADTATTRAKNLLAASTVHAFIGLADEQQGGTFTVTGTADVNALNKLYTDRNLSVDAALAGFVLAGDNETALRLARVMVTTSYVPPFDLDGKTAEMITSVFKDGIRALSFPSDQETSS